MAVRMPMAADSPAGLVYKPDFLTHRQERELLEAAKALPFHEVRMHGVAARRTVIHFGWDYGYESWDIVPAEPLPVAFHDLRDRCAALIAREGEDLEQILVARYPPGAGIGWHRDAPMFGPEVVGVSLGAACRMRFRRKTESGTFEVWPIILEPRSVYVLSGAARSGWQHMIPGTKALRYSITFRTVKSGWKKESALK